MSAIIFDGKKFAAEIEAKLVGKGLGKKLVTILNPEHRQSVVYTNIKAKMAQKIGIDFLQLPISNYQFSINDQISKLNKDKTVNGIMIQQPLVGDKKLDQELCNLISPEKDVDGLGENSPYVPATVRAVQEILNHELRIMNYDGVVVVGSKGVVGKSLLKWLPGSLGMDNEDFNPLTTLEADVVISATGQTGLIKPEMVKEGVVAIDIGYPKADFDPEVVEKAAFLTPVPRGVGPVTVVMLFANLIEGWHRVKK